MDNLFEDLMTLRYIVKNQSRIIDEFGVLDSLSNQAVVMHDHSTISYADATVCWKSIHGGRNLLRRITPPQKQKKRQKPA